ncbi:MAG: DUF5723 family protein [Bacteroidia bacterium]
MKKAKSLIGILALLVAAGQVQAQFELQPSLLRGHVWSQTYQPANIVEGEYEKFRYGAIGNLWLGNTHAPLKGIFAEGGFITEEVKDRLIDDLKPKEDISAGYHLGLAAVNVKLGELPLGIYLDEYNAVYTRFNNPNTLGLILKGNGPYAGQTVSDSAIRGAIVRTRELGVGTGFKTNKLSIGGRLRLKQGIRMADLANLQYALYTDSLGTQVHAFADYDLYTTPKLGKTGLFAFQGFGLGLDLGARYTVFDKLDFEVAVTDIGFTSWKTNHMKETVDVNWEGISITSLLVDSVSPLIQHQVDSIKAILLPDTTEENHLLIAPTVVRLGGTYHLSEQASLSGTLIWSPLASGARTRLPMINVAYQHEVIEGLTLGANVYGLGLDTYGVGAMANYTITAGSVGIDILAGSDNLLGWIAQGIGRGMSVYGGVGVSF